jgi:hypothetical protein
VLKFFRFVSQSAFGLVALFNSSPLLAQSPNWENVASYEVVDGSLRVAQIDNSSLTKAGDKKRFWLRLVKASADADLKNPFLKFSSAERGPSLYEMRCESSELRLIQGVIIIGYDGPLVPLDRPASWEFVVPGSLGQLVFDRICSGGA